MQEKGTRHTVPSYTLLEQPRPGSRETRMRESQGAWLARNDQAQQTEEGS